MRLLQQRRGAGMMALRTGCLLLLMLASPCARGVWAQQEAAEERAANALHVRARQRAGGSASTGADGSTTHARKRLYRPHWGAESPPPPAPPAPSPPAPPPAASNTSSIAQIIDKALEKEFEQDSAKAESEKGRTFNETVESEEGKLETVVRISSKAQKEEAVAAAAAAADEAAAAETKKAAVTGADGGGGGSAAGAGAGGSSGSSGGGGGSSGGGRKDDEEGGGSLLSGGIFGGLSGSSSSGGGSGSSSPAHAKSTSSGGGDSSSSSANAPSIEAAAATAAAAAAEKKKAAAAAAAAAAASSLDKDVDRIIDSRDNEFVLSASKESVATLTLDPILIRDLTCMLAASAACGAAFEAVRQPVINGYLVAGALVGPGGFKLIKELVQVQSVAQLGVQLLLFRLGRELSLAKLRAVWGAALLGGALQIAALMTLGGALAALASSSVSQGVFIGALLSMSSTSVVVKCLEVTRATGSVYGQIVIGTLILQDCAVGLMFALMPAFGRASLPNGGGGADAGWAVASLVLSVVARLALFVAAAMAAARTVLPVALRLLLRRGSKELVQLVLVAVCLGLAWLSGEMELSEELGAFIAGAIVAVAERSLLTATTGAGAVVSARDRVALLPTTATAAAALLPMSGASPRTPPRLGLGLGLGLSSDRGSPRHHRDAAATAVSSSFSLATTVAALNGAPPPSNGGAALSSSSTAAPLAAVAGDDGGHHAGAGLESVTNVLTALFVASMGLIMSPLFLAHHVAVLTLGTLLVMILKSAVTAVVVHLFGVPWRTAAAVGLSMAHIGEFSFVLLSMANQLKLLSPQAYMLLLGVTAMSLLTTPMVIMLTSRLLQGELRLCGGGGGRGGGGGAARSGGGGGGGGRVSLAAGGNSGELSALLAGGKERDS